MYQGETITTTITGFPIPTSEIAELYITFRNNSKILLEKTLNNCLVLDGIVQFEITQQESLSFCVGKIERKVVVVAKDGTRFESCPSFIICEPTSKKEVL